MAQLKNDHVSYAFVAKDIARQATTITDSSSATYVKEGEVTISGLNNVLLTTDAASYTGVKEVKISQLRNSGLNSSPAISFENINFYKVTAYASKVEKIITVGYNGTTGSLEGGVLHAATEYEVKVQRLGLLDHYVDSYNTWKMFSYYNTSDTAHQCLLARKLTKNGVDNFFNEIDGFVKIEMITSSAAAAITPTVSFTYGSKVAVSSAASGLVAGDFIKVNTTDTYYVTGVDGNYIYLEVPYQSTSCTVAPSKVTDSTTGDWGIKMTGMPKHFDSGNGKFRYDVSDFDISLTGFTDATLISRLQSASLGNGEWEEVAQLEWEVQDMNGQTSHTDYLMPTRKRYFEEGKQYDMLVINAYDNSTEQLTGTPKSPFTVIVAIPVSCTQGDSAGSATLNMGVATALDTWLSTNTALTYSEASNLTA